MTMQSEAARRALGVRAVCRFLDSHGADYKVIEHADAYTAAAEARAAGATPETGAKTVMLRDVDSFRLAVIPASERLDLKKVRRLAHSPGLQIATEADLADCFAEFEVGALPPFGLLFHSPSIIDHGLVEQGRIVCNGGDHRHSLVLDAGVLSRIGAPAVADIVVHPRRVAIGPARLRARTTMLALQLTGWGYPPELREVPLPQPGPGQVVIKVGGAAVSRCDPGVLQRPAGRVDFEPPFTLGHETAGWVESLGDGVHGFQIGDAVAVHGAWGCGRCRACRQSSENYCERQCELGALGGGLGLDGGIAEYMLVPAARLLIPLDGLDPRHAAPLTDAALTPYHAIRRSLPKLAPDSTAVVIGGGRRGQLAIQLLSAVSPARIVAVDSSDNALRMATAAGADAAIAPGTDAAERVRAATGGRGAEMVLDLVGSDDTLALAVAVARQQGDVTLVGQGAGGLPFSFLSQPYECSLTTTYSGSALELMEVLDLARAGRIRAHAERFALQDAAEVYERVGSDEDAAPAVICPHGLHPDS